MDPLNRLEEIFAKFPGIGPRQAKRFVYYILNKSPAFAKEFTQLVEEVRKAVHQCDRCHRFFMSKNLVPTIDDFSQNSLLCSICSDKNRDTSLLMVVARDSDFESIEKSGAYRGLYFILGGTVPILDKEPEKRVRLTQLTERVMVEKSQLKEIILSMNTTPEGENTSDIIKSALKSQISSGTIKISLLGRGLSTGAELEYVDSDTITNALKNRN